VPRFESQPALLRVGWFTLFAMLSVPMSVAGQVATDTTRADRVVVDSPHFDGPFETCEDSPYPAAPPRLIGFESEPAVSAVSTELTIRALPLKRHYEFLGSLDTLPGVLSDVIIGLEPLGGGGPTMSLITDSIGLVRVELEPGLYFIKPMHVGFGHGTGVIRARSGAVDSLQVWLDPRSRCR